ncbi:hypothetical protein CYY_009779 [Polysphondylium violaceum]|uniref:GP-PDE domain-containing protein n=1 Tax=Polysphondylium violaceum TaxID=133409 RepID=A0A8J4PMC2_9MYCE|nr:hypothetical protein CYY_009779 [Polysphondylium violaceum]
MVLPKNILDNNNSSNNNNNNHNDIDQQQQYSSPKQLPQFNPNEQQQQQQQIRSNQDKNNNSNNNNNNNNEQDHIINNTIPDEQDLGRCKNIQIFTPSEILLTRVTFKLDIPIGYLTNNQVVSIIGDSNELGCWSVKKSIQLQNTEKTDTHLIWTTTIVFPTSTNITYKYIIVNNLRSPVYLVEWEAAKGVSRHLYIEGKEMFINDGQFGILDSSCKPWVGRGWLPEDEYQLRIQLQVDENPIILFNPLSFDDSELILRIHDPFGLSQDFQLPIYTFKELVLHSSSLQQIGFQVSVVLNETDENGASTPNIDCKVLGKAFITSSQVEKRWGKLYAPIISNEKGGSVIGEFRCNYMVVLPFSHPQNSLSVLWHTFIEQPKSLIGHRGNGKNNFGLNTSAITENTVLSFLTAIRFGGAKMIEFDLQLTFDGIPVIFHDYEIEIQTTEGVVMKETINRLTLDQFLKLKPHKNNSDNPISNAMKKMKKLRVSKSTSDLLALANDDSFNSSIASLLDSHHHHSNINNNSNTTTTTTTTTTNNNNNIPGTISDQHNVIHDRYSTLQEAFTFIPQDIGFMIEIKYPNMAMQKLRNFIAPERNQFVDIILNIVFNEVKDRKIVFLTFDPDIAILLRTKQFRYPVMFLVCSDTPSFLNVFDPDVNVFDTRGNTIKNAVSFVKTVNLDGIVCDSESILSNHSFVNLVHAENLLLFTYGSKNVDPINVKIQNDLGVDGIICDNMTKLSKKIRDDAFQSSI